MAAIDAFNEQLLRDVARIGAWPCEEVVDGIADWLRNDEPTAAHLVAVAQSAVRCAAEHAPDLGPLAVLQTAIVIACTTCELDADSKRKALVLLKALADLIDA